MDRSSGLFWGTIIVLFGLAAFYAAGVHKELLKGRRAEGKIENGNIVKLVRVVDSDTLVVVQKGENPASVRILGIRAFDVKVEKDYCHLLRPGRHRHPGAAHGRQTHSGHAPQHPKRPLWQIHCQSLC